MIRNVRAYKIRFKFLSKFNLMLILSKSLRFANGNESKTYTDNTTA